MELKDGMARVETSIRVFQQLVTLFTLTATNPPNPSHAGNLAHLQSSLKDKKEELTAMVIRQFNTTNLHFVLALFRVERNSTSKVFLIVPSRSRRGHLSKP